MKVLTPLILRFAEELPLIEQSDIVRTLTRSTCGPSNSWDDSDVGAAFQVGEYD